MNIFELYADKSRHEELSEIFTIGAQHHPKGLAANFLEKDIWVTEILRLLYDEKLVGEFSVAFKGGTALSKCWEAILDSQKISTYPFIGLTYQDIPRKINWDTTSISL